ncbi:MAG: hypothetical protein IJ806_11905 [Ruminococcus sp.]|nr:hypothetical protein [Ruminococcus sp.]
MYEELSQWLDRVLEGGLPENAAAVNLNIYEEGDGGWSVQLIASDRYDGEDDSWACFEVFTTGEDLYCWEKDYPWEEAEEDLLEWAGRYLEEGQYADILKKLKAVGAGFVDGDLHILYEKE